MPPWNLATYRQWPQLRQSGTSRAPLSNMLFTPKSPIHDKIEVPSPWRAEEAPESPPLCLSCLLNLPTNSWTSVLAFCVASHQVNVIIRSLSSRLAAFPPPQLMGLVRYIPRLRAFCRAALKSTVDIEGEDVDLPGLCFIVDFHKGQK